MERKLEIGDIVELHSGGPDMTVDGVFDDSINVRCMWFTGLGTEEPILNEAEFNQNSLKMVRRPITSSNSE